MNFIYCIVSGIVMEILQFLLSFLTKNLNTSFLAPIFELFKNNNFDLKSVLNNLDVSAIMPVLKEIFSSFNMKSPTQTVGQNVYGLNPIANVADKDIIYTLNKYLGQPSLA